MREFEKRWTIAGADAKTQATGGANSVLTFPSGEPMKWIDYVLVRPAERWEVVETRVIEERVASDHRPLLAVLRNLP